MGVIYKAQARNQLCAAEPEDFRIWTHRYKGFWQGEDLVVPPWQSRKLFLHAVCDMLGDCEEVPSSGLCVVSYLLVIALRGWHPPPVRLHKVVDAVRNSHHLDMRISQHDAGMKQSGSI